MKSKKTKGRLQVPNDLNNRFLPVEIWHECFTYLPISDHKKLSLTCHLLNEICLPFIFRSITYTCNVSCGRIYSPQVLKGKLDDALDDAQNNVEALKMFANNPEHAPLIKKCVLSYSAPSASNKVSEKARKSCASFIDTFVECLPNFVNMKELDVKHFSERFDKKILMALARHPSLEEVTLMNVKFGVHILKPRIPLRRLTVDNRSMIRETNPNAVAKLLDMFSGEHLESLQAWTEIYAPKLFRAFTKQGVLKRLTHLSFSIKIDHVADLYGFLSSCPNLDQIQMRFPDYNQAPITLPPLPNSAAPLLTSFSGPDTAAKAFIPGRPVGKVEIYPYYDTGGRLAENPSRLFFPLSQGTGKITELLIEPAQTKKEVLDQIVACFPSLEALTISLEIKDLPDTDDEDMDEMYLDGDYLEEDLGGYASVCEGAYEDPIGGGQHLERKSHFCYVHVHTEYLDFLQSVALKEKELPLTIKSLYLSNLLTDNFEYNGIPKNDEKEAEYVRKYGDPYSAMSAQDVFMILSDSYPALRSVTIGGKHSGVLRWVKSDDRTGWLYDTTFNLMEYQRVFFDTPYNDYNPWENSESEGDLGIF